MTVRNKISGIILIGAFAFIAYNITQGYIIKYDIENNGKPSVGKYVSSDKYGKQRSNFILFYINGKKHIEDGGSSPKGFKKNIGKFYRILYSEKYNGAVNAFFDEEITDTTEILKAGFKREEL